MLSGRRRVVAVVAAYIAVCLTLLTSLYDPLLWGHDDSWAIGVLVVAVHVGLGAGVARIWCLAGPLAFAACWFAAIDSDLAFFALLYGLPILVVVTLVGWALGRFADRWGAGLAVAAFVVALVPVAWATAETVKRANAPRVPEAVQRVLGDMELANLCGGAGARAKRAERRAARLLLDQLRRNPGHIVNVTSYDADSADVDHDDMTVRELAEEQAKTLRAQEGSCEPALAHQLDP